MEVCVYLIVISRKTRYLKKLLEKYTPDTFLVLTKLGFSLNDCKRRLYFKQCFKVIMEVKAAKRKIDLVLIPTD